MMLRTYTVNTKKIQNDSQEIYRKYKMIFRFQNSPIKMNSCRTDFCTAKFGHLKVELEEAQVMMMIMLMIILMIMMMIMMMVIMMMMIMIMMHTAIVYCCITHCISVSPILSHTVFLYHSQAQIKQLECQLADHGIRY